MDFPIKFVKVAEMNDILQHYKDCKLVNMKSGGKINYGANFVYDETDTKFTFFRNEGNMKHKHIRGYSCRKDDREDLFQVSTPNQVYKNLRQYAKFPVLKDAIPPFDRKVSGILFRNPSFDGKWIEAVSYDMNSAYGWGACQPMPDTTYEPLPYGIVQEGQVGFNLHGQLRLPGEYAMWRFPTIESPFIRYMQVWYDRKRYAANSQDKKKAKEHIVIAVGYLQKYNFWLRAAIVGYVNRLIIGITGAVLDPETDTYISKNKNFLYGNTDSIIVRKGVKLDLNIGEDMGQWKVEHDGQFAYKGFNYQWKYDIPSVRGKPKSLFDEDFDITVDEWPTQPMPYQFNPVTKQMEEVNWFEEKKI